MTLALSATLAALRLAPAWAQECSPAGLAVRVTARVTKDNDTLTITYTVVNTSGDSVRWLTVGSGADHFTMGVPAQTPTITAAPTGWRGMVVYPEETAYVHLWWQATNAGARLAPGRSLGGFGVRAAGPQLVRPGLIGVDGKPVRPIDFTTLPFTVGGWAGRCWWGRAKRSATPP